jgi:diguanylate cyclase (GGDEF)-like protein
MKNERQLLTAVLSQTASLVWSTDASLRIVEVGGVDLRMAAIDVQRMVKRTATAHQRALGGETTDLDYEADDRVFEVHVAPLVGGDGTIAGCLGLAHDATARIRAERSAVWQAGHDTLTGLPNRTQFREVLASAIRDARRRGGALAVLLLDVDALHSINDAAGQEAGDAVLTSVARRITAATAGRFGYVARLGGDEFAVLVEEAPSRLASAIADAMATPFAVGVAGSNGVDFSALLTMSIGIAELSEPGENGDQLLRAADAALRRAKELGGNQHQFSSPELTTAAAERLGIVSRLRGAMERGELSLAFQPQVRLHDRALLGVEALLRWQCDGELLTAASFIRAVEENPIIIDVGEWVLNEACRQLRSWQDAGLAPPRLALNVGARHFQHPSFLNTVRRAMERHGIEGRCLEIEITETTAMNNGQASVRLIDELRTMGVEITIDDFGTGYSSLAYLKKFAITGVKIDQSFVHDLPSRSASAIVNAILATAHALGLRVVAEGVEDPEQAGFLEAAGCVEAQGYWFARPMSADKLGDYLREERSASREEPINERTVPW